MRPPLFSLRSFRNSRKLESSLFSVTIKISKLILMSSFDDSNLFQTELMLRCPSKTFLSVHYVT